MEISILYWGMWNYKPQAVSLADKIKSEFADANVEIVEGCGGVFEVTFDGKLIYSKKETGEFPEEQDILNILKG